MKSNIKKILYPAVSLFVICLVSAFLLAVTNMLTSDRIAEINKQAQIEQRSNAFPNSSRFEEKDGYVLCYSEGGEEMGFIFTETGKGYGGEITVMTGVDVNGVITGVAVVSHSETSSYGGEAVKNGITDEYKGKQASEFALHKNIDGWTGATRTTNGIIEAVNKAINKYEALKGGGTR